jgi:hypothetical protein
MPEILRLVALFVKSKGVEATDLNQLEKFTNQINNWFFAFIIFWSTSTLKAGEPQRREKSLYSI